MMKKTNGISGQVVLITLLVLTVATTIALSLISRSTTDTSVTNQTLQSSQAFNAAEAGIEEALKTGLGSTGTIVPAGSTGVIGATYAVQVNSFGGTSGIFSFSQKTLEGDTVTLWLVNHDPTTNVPIIIPTYTGNTIDVCWSSETTTPALAVTLLYKQHTDGSYRVAKAAFDPDGTRATSNKFSLPTSLSGGCGAGTGTTYKETLTFNTMAALNPALDTLIALRLRPVYSDASIVVNAPLSIPQQGAQIVSTGSTQDTNRKIIVYQQYRSPSSAFDAAVYSENSFSQ